MNTFESMADTECIQYCIDCMAENIPIPFPIEKRLKDLRVWHLIVGEDYAKNYWDERPKNICAAS